MTWKHTFAGNFKTLCPLLFTKFINPQRHDENPQKNDLDEQNEIIEAMLVGQDAPFRKCVKPEFIRLAPPLHIDQDEVFKVTLWVWSTKKIFLVNLAGGKLSFTRFYMGQYNFEFHQQFTEHLRNS